MKHTTENAIALIRAIEPSLALLGYHTGLTGSVLYKGESEKDTDVILYAHDPKDLKSDQDIQAALRTLGVVIKNETDPEYTKRVIWICEYQERRIDIFLLT